MTSLQPLLRVVVSLTLALMGASLAGTLLLPWLGRLAAGDDLRKDPLASWVAVDMVPVPGAAPSEAHVLVCLERALPGAVTQARRKGGGAWRLETWVRGVRRAERTVVACVRTGGFRVHELRFGLNLVTVLMKPGSAMDRLGGLLAGFVMGVLLALPLMLLGVAWYLMGTKRLRQVLRPSLRLVGLGAAAGLGLVLVSALLSAILSLLGASVREQSLIESVLALGGSWRVIFAVILIVVVPLGEEVFFRGYAFGLLLRENGRATAYLVSSVLFAAVHFHPAGAVFYLVCGLFLAWLTERTGVVVSPIVAHGIINATAVLLMVSRPG